MLRKTIFVLLMIVCTIGVAQAQMKTSASVVSAKPAATSLTAAAGERIDITVKLDIAKKWHIYAHGDSNFIGVDLVPDELFPLVEFSAEYPHGHEGEFFGEKVIMIEGKDVIKASALLPEGMPAGEYPLDLAVTVQACDDKTCLAPVDIPVAIKLTVK